MSCIRPYPVFSARFNGDVFAPCGECLLCRQKKALEWCFYSCCESISHYKHGQDNVFITLTYTEDTVPLNESFTAMTVRKKDVQDFKKRLDYYVHSHYPNMPYKSFYSCEYGGKFSRPHAHLILYGVDQVMASKFVYDAWDKRGQIDIGSLRSGGASYLTKYCATIPTRDALKIMYDDSDCERPCTHHSNHLGSEILDKLIQEGLNNGTMTHTFFGKELPFPSYIRRKYDPACRFFDYKKWYFTHIKKLENLGMAERQYVWQKNRQAVSNSRCDLVPTFDLVNPVDAQPLPSVKQYAVFNKSSLYKDEIPF